MKKILYGAVIGFLFFGTVHAEDSQEIKKSLQTSRQMIVRYQQEQSRLLSRASQDLSAAESKQLKDLEYKIAAVKTDAARLTSLLPIEEQAGEFLSLVLTDEATKPKKELKNYEMIQKTRPLHESALQLVSEQKFEQAANVYEQITLATPGDDQAYLLMGHCQLLTAQYEKAERSYQNAVDIDQSNLNEIVPFFESLIIQDPTDDNNYTHLGYAYLVLGDFIKAKGAFASALEINPVNQNAIRGLRIIQANGL